MSDEPFELEQIPFRSTAFAENPEPRCPCVLLLDTSGSMGGAPQGSVQCDFGVIRGKPGNAELHVTPPGGFTRVLIFVDGKVISDADAAVQAGKSGDLWLVDVNDYEHYRIPQAVISGG